MENKKCLLLIASYVIIIDRNDKILNIKMNELSNTARVKK